MSGKTESNDSIWDESLFVEAQIAEAFACSNCNNIPRECINDSDGKIYCAFCVSELKMVSTNTNAAVDNIIDSLKVKCININTQYENDNNENENDDDNKDENENDISNQKTCEWTGTLSEWKKHNLFECPFTVMACKYCNKFKSMRYLIGKKHENTCDEVAIECKNGCGVKLFRKEMQLHLLNDCMEQPIKCEKCNENDIKKKDMESHLLSSCIERSVECKYSAYGCEMSPNLKFSELNKHYLDYGTYHLELKMDNELNQLNNKIIQQNKIIEHLRYRNQKLQMQIHLKEQLNLSFLIIFESSSSNKNSFISSLNFNYNCSAQNMNLIKAYNNQKGNNSKIMFKRVKDCSYAFASSVYIDKIIGITTKSRQQHINSCISTLNNCICKFNIIYRIGGDTLNTSENNNVCNILGTDVIFQLPQLLIPRFNHKIIYSKIHGILCVGGEPIKKEDVKIELKEIEKEEKLNNKSKKATDNKRKKAILNSVEQLNIAPRVELTHYYNVRNASVASEEEKLVVPPEPELKWRNLGSSMKYRRDCPSIGLIYEGNRSSEQLFVAGGWNERDLSYVEMYNFKTRQWKQLQSLNIKRNSAGICEWKQKNNNMIIIGGWNKKTTHSVEEYDSHKNQWYMLKNTNFEHKYYPSCQVVHDLNPFINTGYGVIVVVGNDGRLYGDEYLKKQANLFKEKKDASSNPNKNQQPIIQQPNIKNDWGFIEFYDPRDWMKKWTVIDSLPNFLNFTHEQCKSLYFQSILSCHNPHVSNTIK